MAQARSSQHYEDKIVSIAIQEGKPKIRLQNLKFTRFAGSVEALPPEQAVRPRRTPQARARALAAEWSAAATPGKRNRLL